VFDCFDNAQSRGYWAGGLEIRGGGRVSSSESLGQGKKKGEWGKERRVENCLPI